MVRICERCGREFDPEHDYTTGPRCMECVMHAEKKALLDDLRHREDGLEHDNECRCDECEAEADVLRQLILNAVKRGDITEDELLDAVVQHTDRPETIAMVEDYRIQREGGL